MKTFKFTGRTPLEALAKATLELGDNYILIDTKEILKEKTKKEIIYEIIVEISEGSISKEHK